MTRVVLVHTGSLVNLAASTAKDPAPITKRILNESKLSFREMNIFFYRWEQRGARSRARARFNAETNFPFRLRLDFISCGGNFFFTSLV